jgi:hypothetical protein
MEHPMFIRIRPLEWALRARYGAAVHAALHGDGTVVMFGSVPNRHGGEPRHVRAEMPLHRSTWRLLGRVCTAAQEERYPGHMADALAAEKRRREEQA